MSPKVVDREAKKAALVAAAQRVFAARGYAATRIADVATEAGVGKGTVYEYFGSKQALFLGVVTAVLEGFALGAHEAAETPTSAHEALGALIDAAFSHESEFEQIFPLLLECWQASSRADERDLVRGWFADTYRHFADGTADLLRAGIARGEVRADVDADAAAAVIGAVLDGLFLQQWFGLHASVASLARRFLDDFFRGIAAPGGAA